MSLILHLGVIDVPYQSEEKKGSSSETTGDVAERLEAHYSVMETFTDRHGGFIADALANSMAGALENIMAGAPPSNNPFGSAESAIEERFRAFIDGKEMNGVPGVPTKASLLGIRSRFKNRRDPGRPSFQDTGLYETSFKAWMET